MRTTFDAEADAAYIYLVPEMEPGRSVRTIEAPGVEGGVVVLDFDVEGILLGVEIVGARQLLDPMLVAGAERIDL
ncbi:MULTISPECIES: DUF2283 domain-containing protein [unclassified Microbacterium]|uniref:DUF2283 domain-containing protein n=1 Tax=unclassified Microbacterium TaxID=2609290 RepID=UPI00366290FF